MIVYSIIAPISHHHPIIRSFNERTDPIADEGCEAIKTIMIAKSVLCAQGFCYIDIVGVIIT